MKALATDQFVPVVSVLVVSAGGIVVVSGVTGATVVVSTVVVSVVSFFSESLLQATAKPATARIKMNFFIAEIFFEFD
jgi:hypothetical protein